MPITHPYPPSPYQTAIFDYIQHGTGHLVVKAVAGGSKTTTAIESLKYLPKGRRVLFLAFNKAIAMTLESRVPANVKASTFHAYGFSIVKRLYPDAIMAADKVYDAIQELSETNHWIVPEDERVSFFNRVEKLVNLMRLTLKSGFSEVESLCDQFDILHENNEIDYAMEVFVDVTTNTKQFDFADMLYIPATQPFAAKGFDAVYVDEFQDCCEAQYRFVRKLLAKDGRLIVIGDPNQSIYAYMGAEPRLFDEAIAHPNTISLPLSISYRCAKSIVAHAQKLVPEIEANPDAPEGEVVTNGSITHIQDGDFVLCRINMPLVKLALDFIRQGRKAVIRGSDIGKNLVTFLKPYQNKTLEDMERRLDAKRDRLVEKLLLRYPDKDLESIPDYSSFMERYMTVQVLADDSSSVNEIISKIYKLFSDDATTGIILSTVHKAKGLEADNVFIIEPQLIPFPLRNELPWEIQQERNIDYVARTRAIKRLEYVKDWTCFAKKGFMARKAAKSSAADPVLA